MLLSRCHSIILTLYLRGDRNLKTAQKLGMETICESFHRIDILVLSDDVSVSQDVQLGDSLSAVKNLAEKLGIDLTSPDKQIWCSTKL